MNKSIVMRLAVPDDTALVFQFIRELAEYENLSCTVMLTEDILHEWILSRKIEVLLAEYKGEPAGFAICYFTFSTFRGQTGLYIEDLFVRPLFRRHGIGTMFFHELAQIARQRNCFRIDWMVLDWNVNSIAFYEQLGGVPVGDWITFRLQDDALATLV